jgi:hypothetical protein
MGTDKLLFTAINKLVGKIKIDKRVVLCLPVPKRLGQAFAYYKN